MYMLHGEITRENFKPLDHGRHFSSTVRHSENLGEVEVSVDDADFAFL